MPSEQEEAQESFMFKFFTLPIAKIKVNKYNKNAPNHLNSVTLTLGQNGLILPLILHIVLVSLNIWAKFHENPSKNE